MIIISQNRINVKRKKIIFSDDCANAGEPRIIIFAASPRKRDTQEKHDEKRLASKPLRLASQMRYAKEARVSARKRHPVTETLDATLNRSTGASQ